jgi:NAD(P)-dependent dehydrogenase (short-subunit alcohol dehydrogenase family)
MSDAFDKFDLTGKTALVTGGATGIGYFMSRGLMRSGAKVMLAARRENVLKEAAAKLKSESKGGEVLYCGVDLGKRASVQALAAHAAQTMGGVDIFIGNAAQDVFEPIDKITDDAIDRMFQVNVSANIELMRAFVPRMRKNKWGRIMFSSSTTSILSSAQEGMANYTATKASLNALARTVAVETGHDGITVNSILLGVFLTPMLQEQFGFLEKSQGAAAVKAFTDGFTSMTALGRLARCEEIEGFIQLLASDAGSYITGSSLTIDGGLSVMLRPNPPPANPVYPRLS